MNPAIPKKPRRPAKIVSPDDPYQKAAAFIPKSVYKLLFNESITRDIPVSQLMVIAADKQLESPEGLDYDLPMPISEFKPNAYAEQAVKIYEFLKKFPAGTGLRNLWMFRREIGIIDKTYFMLGYRELLQSGMVEEIYPRDSYHKYHRDYRYVRIAGLQRKLTKSYRTEGEDGN